jgi:hypothetical protein
MTASAHFRSLDATYRSIENRRLHHRKLAA